MEEREIDLIDMLADVLSHWRCLLVALLIGAILMGAFSYVQSYKSVKKELTTEATAQDEISREEAMAELEESLNETQKVAVSVVISDEEEYALKEKYYETSAIMQMDPLQIARRELVYKIQVEDIEQSYILGTVYEDLINNVELYQWVEEQTGISADNVKELISVDAKSNLVILNGVQDTTGGNDTMKVFVIHENEQDCEKMAKAIKSYIEKLHSTLVEELGAHELVLLSESEGTIMDYAVIDKQVSYDNTQMVLLTNIAKAKDAFTDDQMRYYMLLTEQEIEETNSETKVAENVQAEELVVVATPSVSMKYVFLGAVLFSFVYAGILFVIYILNGKLRASDELSRLYCISQMGVVVKASKKKFFLDKWIEALRNRGKRQFTAEQSLALATSAVKIAAMKNGLDNICLMGCNLEAGAGVVCESIKAALQKEQVAVTVLDNVLYDAVAMEQLDAVKGVVLVEKAGSTLYNEVTKELELLARQDITVLGGIVVE